MIKNTLTLLIISFFLFSCEKDPEITRITSKKIIINFTQTVDSNRLVIGSGCMDGGDCFHDHSCCSFGKTLGYTNSAGENYNIQTLKYLISDITLHKEEGEEILLKEVHFIDLSDPTTLVLELEEIPNGNYVSISFTMGLDSTKNISNFYVNESFHPAMFWPDMMGGGYHYMKLEGAYNNDSTFYNTHTGGTMGINYSFDNNFDISLSNTCNTRLSEININMEINNWYQNPNLIHFSAGIMGDMTKQMNLKENGKTDVFSVKVNSTIRE